MLQKDVKREGVGLRRIPIYTLEVAVFLCGFVTMALEMVGSRVLAPFAGTTIEVWSSLISVILFSLSFGYWFGGRTVDRAHKPGLLAVLICAAAVLIGLVPWWSDWLLFKLSMSIRSLPLRAIAATILLFSAPTILLGMVSPFAIKLRLNATGAGRAIGTLYALSTVGSIAGTCLTGFYLIEYFGTAKILEVLALILVAASLLVAWQAWRKMRLVFMVLLCCALPLLSKRSAALEAYGFIDTDTRYSRVWIFNNDDSLINNSHRPIRTMRIGPEYSSAIFLDSSDLVFPYMRYFRLAKHFRPHMKHVLLIGGAAYAYPKNFLSRETQVSLDVVEIDSGVTALARRYFGLRDHPHLHIYHEDARSYLNLSHDGLYDAILVDAFWSNSIPFQLTTLEATRRMAASLTDGGVVITNLISALVGEKAQFLAAELATYRQAFPQVLVLPVTSAQRPETVQNVILIGIKSTSPVNLKDVDAELEGYLAHRWSPKGPSLPALLDDYAPVERYVREQD